MTETTIPLSSADAEGGPIAWDILDRRTVERLVTREGADAVLATLVNETPAPTARVDALCALAVAGKLIKLREQAGAFRAWTDGYGLRRLSNASAELDRVAGLPKRGIAILEAQALSRFIRTHVEADIEVLKQAISAS